MKTTNPAALNNKRHESLALTSVAKITAIASARIVRPQPLSDSCLDNQAAHPPQSLPNSKLYGLALPLILLLSGCLAAPIKPSLSKLDTIRTVFVVPMEAPPLEVIPDLIETRIPVYSQYHYQSMPSYQYLHEKIYRNPGGILIAGLVDNCDSVPVVDLLKTPPPIQKHANLEAAALTEYWTPTVILAQNAASFLNKHGVKAIVSKHYDPLPIASENRNASAGNWRNAIKQWYSQESSDTDYRQPGMEQADAIVELGIDHYRIFYTQTSLQVLIKLIDPKTRRVIGRISAKNYSAENAPQTLLGHDAEKFKQLVTGMGAQLFARGFSELGLTLKVSQSPDDGITP